MKIEELARVILFEESFHKHAIRQRIHRLQGEFSIPTTDKPHATTQTKEIGEKVVKTLMIRCFEVQLFKHFTQRLKRTCCTSSVNYTQIEKKSKYISKRSRRERNTCISLIIVIGKYSLKRSEILFKISPIVCVKYPVLFSFLSFFFSLFLKILRACLSPKKIIFYATPLLCSPREVACQRQK